jgi:hypothetical protein
MQEMLATQAPLWLARDDSPAALAEAVQRCLAQAPADRQVAIDRLQGQHRLENFVQAWDELLTLLLHKAGQGPKKQALELDASPDEPPSGGRP